MKIRYSFVNETISIDVPDDWGEILIDLDRQEYNNDHKETRRHYSLEGKVYEGMDYAAEDSGLEALFAGPTMKSGSAPPSRSSPPTSRL